MFQNSSLSSDESLIQNEIVRIRRHLHQNPELSCQEHETQIFIVQQLKNYGFEEVHSGLGGTGVAAILRGEQDESILLRADTDALPLQEQTNLEFSSTKPKIMHACGHDAHTAMLLGAALSTINKVKAGYKLKRGVKFCFQPAEEILYGAEAMIKDTKVYDLLDASPKVINCYGLHVNTKYPCHQILYAPGPVKAACDLWTIEIVGIPKLIIQQGSGGHAMAPQDTKDPLQIGSQLINEIHQIKSRNLNQLTPSTISIGEFKSGVSPNVINEKANLTGTIRTLFDKDRQVILDRFKQLCLGSEIQHDCKITFSIVSSVSAVVNDPSIKDFVSEALNQVGNVQKHDFELAGEDFSQFSERKPSAYIILGAAGSGEIQDGQPLYAPHSPIFRIDEDCMITGVRIWLSLINQWNL